MNNKVLVLFVVLFACAVLYFRGYGPGSNKTPAQPAQGSAKTEENSGQQSLPDAAKNLTVQIKTSDEEEDNEMNRREHAAQAIKDAEDRDVKRFDAAVIAGFYNPAPEFIFFFDEPPKTLKWPCTTATYEEITKGYGYVWGKNSPEPQDNVWNALITEDLIDYGLCRAVELDYPKLCWSLELFAEARNDAEFRNYLADHCKHTIHDMWPILYSMGKATREQCEEFSKSEKNETRLCDEIKKHRGAEMCNALKLTGKTKTDCLSLFPAKKSDCDSLSGINAKQCNEKLSLIEAISSGDIKKCPKTGRSGIACMAYLSRGSNNSVCKPIGEKLSRDFCSGGKYAKTRKPNLQ